MSKKPIIAATTITGLLLSLFGMQFVEVAIANPFARFMPIDPPTDAKLPVITVLSPKNGEVYSSANFTFEFSVTSPETNGSMHVEEVYYVTDWRNEETLVRYYVNPFSLGGVSTSVKPTLPPFYEPAGAPSTINFSCSLSNVTEGNHHIQVHAWCEFYNNTGAAQLYYSLNSTSYAYFKTSDSISPLAAPTPSPIPTPRPSPSFTPITSAPAAASPSVPEFPTWTAVSLIATATLSVALFAKRKKTRINSTLKKALVEERMAKSNPKLV